MKTVPGSHGVYEYRWRHQHDNVCDCAAGVPACTVSRLSQSPLMGAINLTIH
jgi:hypothetical protein